MAKSASAYRSDGLSKNSQRGAYKRFKAAKAKAEAIRAKQKATKEATEAIAKPDAVKRLSMKAAIRKRKPDKLVWNKSKVSQALQQEDH
jgi:hypothetical protein